MKKVIFIHNTTGKEITVKCESVENRAIDNSDYYLCSVKGKSEEKTIGIFPFSQYAMYVSKIYAKTDEKVKTD